MADDSGFYSVMLPLGTYNPRINGDSVDKNAGTITPVGSQYLVSRQPYGMRREFIRGLQRIDVALARAG